MTISIVPIDQEKLTDYKILVYGEDKVGKTTLIKTLPLSSDEKLLYIGGDPGELALRGRKYLKVRSKHGKMDMDTLREIYEWCLSHCNSLEWIAIDGINKIGDRVVEQARASNSYGPAAWDEAQTFMDWWITAMRDISGPKTLVIAHIMQDTDDSNKIWYRPDMPGNKMKAEITRYFDEVLCMRMIQQDESNRYVRVLHCNRDLDPQYKVGDRSGMLDTFEPPDLTHVMKKVESGYPDLVHPDVSESMRVNLMALAKANPKFRELLKERAKSLGVKSIAEFKTAQLEELMAIWKGGDK